jgi:hypothetical protein
LSTESVWHRCGKDYPASLSDLPEGRYSVTIADDVSLEWYNARGLAFSGWTQPCWDNPTTYAPTTSTTTSLLYVDGTPPTVSEPRVVSSGFEAVVSVDAGDEVAGVGSIEWTTGDGYRYAGQPYIAHRYLAAGTWNGSVTATDRAGNQTTRPFSVTVQSTAGTVPSITSPSGTSTTGGVSLRLAASAATRQRVLARRAVLVKAACSRACLVSARGVLRIGARRYSLASRSRTLDAGKSAVLRLAVGPRARRALARAMRRKRQAIATVTLVATNAAGKRTTKTVRIKAV